MLAYFASLHRHAKRGKKALNFHGGRTKYSCWRWGTVKGAWDVARMFNRQPTPAATVRTADCSALLAIWRFYEGAFSMSSHQPVESAIVNVKGVRNESFGHVQDLMLDDETAKKGVNYVLRLLQEAQRHYPDDDFEATTTCLLYTSDAADVCSV